MVYLLPLIAAVLAVAWLKDWKRSDPDRSARLRVGCAGELVTVIIVVVVALVTRDTSSGAVVYLMIPAGITWLAFGRLIAEYLANNGQGPPKG